jgi:hypothetical protein
MSDVKKPERLRALPDASIPDLWLSYRRGPAPKCPNEGAHIALQVNSSAKCYRLVCVECGIASFWFAPGEGGALETIADDELGDY